MEKNEIIYGYDKVKWGASIEEVKTLYPGIEYYEDDREIDNQKGTKTYIRTFEKGIMSNQMFFFFEDKLFRVSVAFNQIDGLTEKELMGKLVEKYGKFDTRKEDTRVLDEYAIRETEFYINHVSPKLMIIMAIIENIIERETGAIIQHSIYIDYAFKEMADMVESNFAKKNMENIDL